MTLGSNVPMRGSTADATARLQAAEAEREAAAVKIQSLSRARAARKSVISKKAQRDDANGRKPKLNAREKRRLGLHRDPNLEYVPFEPEPRDRLAEAGQTTHGHLSPRG